MGVPISLKLQSFNVFGGAVQDLATCVAYTYTPIGSGRMGRWPRLWRWATRST